MANKKKIQSKVQPIFVPIQKNKRWALMMFLLGAICIVFEPWNSLRYLSLLEFVLDLYLVCFLLSLLPQKIKVWTRIVLSWLFYSVALLDNLVYSATGAPMSSSVLKAMIHTHAQEAGEALQNYLHPNTAVWLIVIIAVLHLFLTLIRKSVSFSHLFSRKWAQACLFFLLVVGAFISFTNKRYLYYRLILGQQDTELPQSVMDAQIKTGYYLPIHRFWQAINEIKRDGKAISHLTALCQLEKVTRCQFTSPDIVLIIGESYNKYHSQLYGYQKATTPFEKLRLDEGRMTVFTDVVTPWNFTTEALSHILSLQPIEDKKYWYEAPLFTSLFKQAGYHVQFISNQYVEHPAKNLNSLVDTQLLNDSLLSQLQFSCRNADMHLYDGALLNDYDSLKTQQGKYNLIIFHLRGQHVEFGDRVPSNWQHFKALQYDRPELNEKQRQILADYDNATRYVDFVTEQILRRFEKRDAIVIFLTDHGERVFDNGTTVYGRSNSLYSDDIQQQYEIPFWIWTSATYEARHAKICQAIRSAKQRPYMTDQLSHLLLYLGGISSPYYKEEHNLISPKFCSDRQRMLRGRFLYETK